MPKPIGSGPPPRSRCVAGPRHWRIRIHLELFAHRRAIVIPARIGLRQHCRYPLRTLTPTGVIEIDRHGSTLGEFFAVWRMPLSARRMLGFRGEVAAFVAGRRWRTDVRRIPLADRAQIVLEVGGYIPPHRFYLFPPIP